MTRSIRALALPFALALPLAFTACSPTVRDYGSGSGLGGSSSGTGPSSSSAGGTGGTGGGAMVHCVNSGAPFDIMTTSDFGASAISW